MEKENIISILYGDSNRAKDMQDSDYKSIITGDYFLK